ncbi:hypothetical protein BDV28DRAFT_129791 [Aspergillus coremiiformis]|uniref:Uncharacterized protein n=1 Tax=Aspergillus coremiiformis TaxID=138285 RepID=A0A5N6ZDQ3_9EURO|nr:hypothetical protein BDV28DRAFT_129791 [Aspergillus coremiiformis]
MNLSSFSTPRFKLNLIPFQHNNYKNIPLHIIYPALLLIFRSFDTRKRTELVLLFLFVYFFAYIILSNI